MRKSVQALIAILGLSAGIAAFEAGQSKPPLGNCLEMAAPTAPTACN